MKNGRTANNNTEAGDIAGRYHVIGVFADGGLDLFSAERCKADAFTAARRAIGPKWYTDARVFDSKAHRGAIELWAADGTVLERRAS